MLLAPLVSSELYCATKIVNDKVAEHKAAATLLLL